MSEISGGIFDRFERYWSLDHFALHNFISQCDTVVNSDVQLELVKLDIRKRLQHGQFPVLENYEKHFSHFAGLINKLIEEELISFANSGAQGGPLRNLPQRVGQYEIHEFVYQDSASVHYDAIQSKLDRRVKVKSLRFPNSETLAKAKLIALLEHANFENSIDLIQTESGTYLVSQAEFGNSLEELLIHSPELITPRRSVAWMKHLVEALMEAHRFDLAHLNISPENILIRDGGEPVLLNPSLDIQLEKRVANSEPGSLDMLPFPYRSITHNGTSDLNLWLGDAISIGLIFFQLLTKMPLEVFYKEAPLPDEAKRLKKLIADRLDYETDVEPELKAICRRATLDAMTDIKIWSLSDFHAELLILESLFDAETSIR
jgi:serine/threonine protein kinase